MLRSILLAGNSCMPRRASAPALPEPGTSSTDEEQVDFGGEGLEFVTVSRHQRRTQAVGECRGKTVGQRNPPSLRIECSRRLPKRRIQIGLNPEACCAHGADSAGQPGSGPRILKRLSTRQFVAGE